MLFNKMTESNTAPRKMKLGEDISFLPIVSGSLALFTVVLAFTRYKSDPTKRSLLLITAGVFTNIFGSSFSNYIQTIELEKKQSEIVNQMPVGEILKILEKKQTQDTKAKIEIIKKKFDK